jgi:hypothetical protein
MVVAFMVRCGELACRVRIFDMQVTSARVVAGHVELDTDLPEGTNVTVLVPEGDETFEADPELERALLRSIAQGKEGKTVPFESVLAELRSRE